MKIICPNTEGGVAVIHPTGLIPIEEVAKKDVPYNTPYLIVADDIIPTDREYRDAWDADFSNPDGYGLGAQRWFIQQAAKVIESPDSTPQEIEAAMQLSEQMQREIIELEGAPM
jgi:hypothetical protein